MPGWPSSPPAKVAPAIGLPWNPAKQASRSGAVVALKCSIGTSQSTGAFGNRPNIGSMSHGDSSITDPIPALRNPIHIEAVQTGGGGADYLGFLFLRDSLQDSVQDLPGLGESGLSVGIVGSPHELVHADDVP